MVEAVKGEKGKWFWDNLEVKLGVGSVTSFEDGLWSSDRSLKDMYPRLYQLSAVSESKVIEMGSWDEGAWRWKLRWRRELRDREKEGETALIKFLQQFVLSEGTKNMWHWRGKGGDYLSIKAAYEAIMKRCSSPGSVEAVGNRFDGVWRTQALFKTQVFAWRLLWDRLPTKDNLIKRNIRNHLDPMCSCCNSVPESANHIFLHCPDVQNLWCRIVNWVGSCWTPPLR